MNNKKSSQEMSQITIRIFFKNIIQILKSNNFNKSRNKQKKEKEIKKKKQKITKIRLNTTKIEKKKNKRIWRDLKQKYQPSLELIFNSQVN